METYVNNKTLIEDDIAILFKSSVTCPICVNILINPVICINCQKVHCKKCIDNPINEDKKCLCDNPNYQKAYDKIEILSKLKFICFECGEGIPYDEAQKHHGFCCPFKTIENTNFQKTKNEKKFKKLKSEEVEILRKKGYEISCMTSKYNYNYYSI